MLYTRKGDSGTTKTFGCDQRISKSSAVAEALGTLDETNSYIGVAKSKSGDLKFGEEKISDIAERMQNDLFIVQAQVAGADKKIPESEIKYMEEIVDGIEKELPAIKTFFISGASEISAHFDFARTLARRAERRVVGVSEEGLAKIDPHTLTFLNRLSSLLYALARFSAAKSGNKEKPPTY